MTLQSTFLRSKPGNGAPSNELPGDGEAAERCGEDGVAYSVEELRALVFVKGEERAKGSEGKSAVAEEEEEEEEHDDELGNDADGVAEETGEVSSEIGGGAAVDYR